jgi:TolB protein
MMMSYSALNGKWVRGLTLLLIVTLLTGLALAYTSVAQAAIPTSGPVIVGTGGAQLYSAPDGDVVTTLPIGTVFTASGRTDDNLLVVGQTADVKGGWLKVDQLIAVGVELLPIYSGDGAALSEGIQAPAEPTATNETVTGESAITGTVASGTDRLNVRSGPGTAYAVIAKAVSGERYALVGRSIDGAWLQINRGGGEMGWVAAAYLHVEGDLSLLPVVTASSPPTTAAPAAQSQTAAPSGAAVSDLSGTLVIETSPGGLFYGYSLASGALWPLTHGFDPAISPDGQTVTFVRDGGENGVYLIDIDGSNERLIFSGRARLSSPKWSPDGAWILFTRSDGTYHCLDVPGSCITLPSGPNGGPMRGAQPDTVTRYWYNLARVDRDGNNYRDIASLTSARAADWNEAGIVYASAAGLQITADVPDAENKLVIFDYLKPFYHDPDWQPNGGRIVYMGKEASHWELFSVNPDGSDKMALTHPETTVVDVIPSNVAPAWSPDGKHIVFLSNREENHEAGAWRVWVMDADGSNQHPLPVNLEINYTFGDEQSVSWAP